VARERGLSDIQPPKAEIIDRDYDALAGAITAILPIRLNCALHPRFVFP
jgi:hypothetical protein